MVLGIASIFPGICISCIGIGLGVAAVVIAKQELANISKGISPAGNASNANIGFYTGIAGIALNILFTLLYLVFNLLGAIAR
ncbi:MAG: hypothetical protein RMM17_02305 [Acidobacteriota bacterium]|nr:hypothetical protein [Blastocatellia bacterium]MDW8411502.1 hypothetical protein [Acidobacteriota bacterium]